MNLADFIILGIIALVVFFAVRRLIKNKKSGKCNCGCDCGCNCTSGNSDSCGKIPKESNE